jgi:V/A-type H+-transporting ATPase subunit E
MQNKLQELTDKLYNEGLSKGKQQAEQLLAEAEAKAGKIVQDAQTQADQILSKARKDADDLKTKVAADVKMASTQSISALKQQIEKTLMAKVVGSEVKDALQDANFVKPLIETVIKSFNAADIAPAGLDVILPESMKQTLGKALESGLAKELKSSVNIDYAKNIAGGFKIAPKDGGYFISFADGDFEKMFSEYLRPAAKKILFSE